MIETHLILLEVNIFQRTGGDSRREKRGEDERVDGRGERGIFKKLYLSLSAGPHIGLALEHTYMCVFVYPHGIIPAAACISDRLLSRCFPLVVFLYLLHLCSLSEKVYPLGPIWAPGPQGLRIPKAPTHRSPSGSLLYHRENPQEPPGPSDCGAAALHNSASLREGGGAAVWEYN